MAKQTKWTEGKCAQEAVKRAMWGIGSVPAKGEYESDESYRERISRYAINEYKSLMSQTGNVIPAK